MLVSQQQRRERELRKQQEREQRHRYEEQLRREEERRQAEREQVHTRFVTALLWGHSWKAQLHTQLKQSWLLWEVMCVCVWLKEGSVESQIRPTGSEPLSLSAPDWPFNIPNCDVCLCVCVCMTLNCAATHTIIEYLRDDVFLYAKPESELEFPVPS